MADERLRAARARAGLTQAQLAERVDLSRQSLLAIESGRARPSVDAALRLAEALGASVEALFANAATAHPPIDAGDVEGPAVVGRVGSRWVAHHDPSRGARPVDAWVRRSGRRAAVEWLVPPDGLAPQLLVAGCAPALGALAARLERDGNGARAAWLPWSSQRAFDALLDERVHVAGVHLDHDNASLIAASRGDRSLAFVTLARWPVGLAFRRDDARIRGARDLARPRLRVALRERGAGARRLLERTSRAVGAKLAGRTIDVGSHDAAAQAVALGAADVCVTGADVAAATGLGFHQLAEERFDLVMTSASLADPRVVRLLEVLAAGSTRRELELRGYGTAESGRRIASRTP